MFQKFDIQRPQINEKEYVITGYGAVSGGKKSNTKAFAKAIEAAAENGGRVIIPDGIWLTGPIELKSGVELHLEDNAVIVFDKNPEEYPLIVTDYEGIKRIRAKSPICAEGASDIAITGNGVIDGSGHLWRPVKEFKMTARQWKELLKQSEYVIDSKEGGIWVPTKSIYDGRAHGEVFPDHDGALDEASPFYDFYRPVMVSLKHCRRVLIEGVLLQNSPAWCLHPYFCEDVTVRNIRISNPYYAQNGDGIDVESCKNVEVCYSDFSTGDDAICMKAGKDREARKIPGPCENVHIHHCYVGYGHGGFVIGSEMSRGVKNVLVEDCSFVNSDVGVRLKSAMGRGGTVENIYIRNINMVNMKKEAVVMTMDYVHNLMDYHDPVVESSDEEDVPKFRNIYIENCVCKGAEIPVRICGLSERPDTIREIYFKNCDFAGEKENLMKDCENIYFE